MLKSNKKLVVFVVWLAVLGALGFAIQKLNTMSGDGSDGPPPIPKVDAAKLAKNWTAIMNHASPPQGPAAAPYTLVEFGDFECPQCYQARPLLETTIKGAPVNFYFVERPIRGHFYAVPAAQAALSANAQGKFWPMYDTLYMHHTDLEPGFYSDYAAKIGLNGAALQKDVDSHRYQSQVEESVKFCTSIGIVSTPTIAVRNNKTGQVTAAVGLENIMALLKQPPWSTSAPPGSAVAAAPGSGSIVAKGQ